MKIIRRDPAYFSPLLAQWPTIFDEDDLVDSQKNLGVYETDEALVVKANVAGVSADNVDISIDNGIITIKAENEESEEEKKKKKVVYREARRTQYVYTTNIPCPVSPQKAEAEVQDGMLTLTLPKADEAKPKKIKATAKK